VGALGHYIEREGVPTAQVSLIREQTAAIRPPRALWVPFMLGRPFGVPNDAAFQRRVLSALLTLFEREQGPVLEDYPEEAPGEAADAEGYACPVNFARVQADDGDPGKALVREVEQLAVWYDLAVKRRGRTTVGISGMPVEALARFLASWVAGAPEPNPRPDVSLALVLKRACDDLKAYYFEALGAQPGNLSAKAIDRWFWNETAAAKAFIALRARCADHPEKHVRIFVERSLLPRAIQHTLES